MDEALNRLSILEETAFITRGEARDIQEVLEMLRGEHSLGKAGVDYAPFTVHLAAVLRRARLGEQLELTGSLIEKTCGSRVVYAAHLRLRIEDQVLKMLE
ncbi:MAG: hypothetical protein ACLTSX_08600 [Collinsella sp.]